MSSGCFILMNFLCSFSPVAYSYFFWRKCHYIIWPNDKVQLSSDFESSPSHTLCKSMEIHDWTHVQMNIRDKKNRVFGWREEPTEANSLSTKIHYSNIFEVNPFWLASINDCIACICFVIIITISVSLTH